MTIARACRPPAQEECQRLAGRWWIAQHPPRGSDNVPLGRIGARDYVQGQPFSVIGVRCAGVYLYPPDEPESTLGAF